MLSTPSFRVVCRVAVVFALALANATAVANEPASLAEAFRGRFLVGAALPTGTINGREPRVLELVSREFNTITAENVMKWSRINPRPGRYDFDAADRFVAFGEQHGMRVIGHTLVWHQQTPDWVFEPLGGRPVELSRDELLARMRLHIATVVGRYRGRVHGWDVVNEALDETGGMRDSPWRRIIGDDYLEHAFRFAHEADPDAELYYNDYNLKSRNKRRGAIRLVESLLAAGCRVDAIGVQGHWQLDRPSTRAIGRLVDELAEPTGRVMVTELDVMTLPYITADSPEAETAAESPALNPYRAGLPEAVQREQAERYTAIFRTLAERSDVVDRVTLWGVQDGQSWRNHYPAPGRTDYPLLFDRSLRPKRAYDAVLEVRVGSGG